MSLRRLLSLVLLLPALALAEAPVAPATPGVELIVPGKAPSRLDAAALAALPLAEVTKASHEEVPARWSGVALVDVLRQAGVPLGKELRGPHHATLVRVTAADGYQVVFSLAELDAGFGNRRVLLVHQRDGKPLAEDGPFRLVVPDDQRAGRWLRNLRKIEVIDVATSHAANEH